MSGARLECEKEKDIVYVSMKCMEKTQILAGDNIMDTQRSSSNRMYMYTEFEYLLVSTCECNKTTNNEERSLSEHITFDAFNAVFPVGFCDSELEVSGLPTVAGQYSIREGLEGFRI